MKLRSTIPKSEYNSMRSHYTDILHQRDREIEELKKENQLLLQNAITQAKKRHDLATHSKRLIEINRELKDKIKNGN